MQAGDDDAFPVSHVPNRKREFSYRRFANIGLHNREPKRGFFNRVHRLPNAHHELCCKVSVSAGVPFVGLLEVILRVGDKPSGRQGSGFSRIRRNTSSAGRAFFLSLSSFFRRSRTIASSSSEVRSSGRRGSVTLLIFSSYGLNS